MKAFKVNSNGDLIIKNGDLVMIEGQEELRQSVERILTTNINEWFLDTEFGLDYSELQGKGKREDGIKLALSEAIYQDPRIKTVDIKNIEIDINRHLKVTGIATDFEGNEIDLGTLQQEVVSIG